jgi:flagellar hook-length control protein FliK
MNSSPLPTTGVSGSLFDVPSSSVPVYSAQQGIAPFSSLLQQAQTVPPVQQSQGPAPQSSPPTNQQPGDVASNRTADDSQANASTQGVTGNTDNNATSAPTTQQPPSQQLDASGGNSQPDAIEPKASNPPNTQTAGTFDEVKSKESAAREPTPPSLANARRQSGATIDASANEQEATNQTISAIKSNRTAKQRDSDKLKTDKESDNEKTGDRTSAQSAITVVDTAAQAAAQNAATVTPIPINDAGQHTDPMKGGATASIGGPLLQQSFAATSQRTALSATGPHSNDPKVNGQDGTITANPLPSGSRALEASQSGRLISNATPGKPAVAAVAASQSAPPSTDAILANSASVTVTDLTTATVDSAQAISTITADVVKSADTTPITTQTTQAGNAASLPAAPVEQAAASPTNPTLATPSSFAAGFSQGPSPEGSSAPGLSTIDRARFVQRVARAFQSVGDQGGQIRLRLSPPDLGSLQMQISVKDGGLTAHIQADNSTVQQVLLDSLPELRDRLAQQNIQIDRFDVEVAGQSSGGLPQSPQGNPDFDQAGRRAAVTMNPPSIAAAAETNQVVNPASAQTSGALNVVV